MSIACNPAHRRLISPKSFIDQYLNTNQQHDPSLYSEAEYRDIKNAIDCVKKAIESGHSEVITVDNSQYYEFRMGNYEVMTVRYVTKLIRERTRH